MLHNAYIQCLEPGELSLHNDGALSWITEVVNFDSWEGQEISFSTPQDPDDSGPHCIMDAWVGC